MTSPPIPKNTIPVPAGAKIQLVCKDCTPELRLFWLRGGRPTQIDSFGIEQRSIDLDPRKRYRLIFVSEDASAKWSYDLHVLVAAQTETMRMVKAGTGQQLMRNDVEFVEE